MSYTFKPYRGYHVQDVIVDGKSMGQLDSYTFSSVSENQNIRSLNTLILLEYRKAVLKNHRLL